MFLTHQNVFNTLKGPFVPNQFGIPVVLNKQIFLKIFLYAYMATRILHELVFLNNFKKELPKTRIL